MLSYIHAYHAGNHADILKHITISLILEYLKKKDKPFSVFDSHSGSGLYDLSDERLLKTNECEIERLLNAIYESDFDFETSSISKYVSIVQKYYEKNKYPGSPLLESELLREQDELILSELHPKAIEELKESAKDFPHKPKVHFRDGYEMLLSLTPPKTKRGLCVIDPSFEDAEDYSKCGETISKILKKWSNAVIALWYPLVSHRVMEISMMKETICSAIDSTEPRILDIQFEVKDVAEMTGLASLYGSGMFIVNFPYKLDEEMEQILPFLKSALNGREYSLLKR